MKTVKYLIILLNAISLMGCENSNVSNDSTINIELKNVKVNFQDTTAIKDISYVFLETKKESMIGNCDKLLTNNDNIYILDRTSTHSVFVFDKKGNFQYKINKRGKGPGEYIQIFDFYVDKQGNIYIWDVEKKSIIIYFENGTKFNEHKMNYSFLEFVPIGKDEIIVRSLFEKGMIKAPLARINYVTQKSDIIINSRSVYDDIEIVRNSSHYFFISENSILYNPMFTNEILEIKNNNIFNKIIFNKDNFPNEGFVKQIKVNPMLQYTTDYYVSDIINIYQNSEVYVMTLIKGMPQMLVIDKKNNNTKIIVDFSNKDYFGRNGIYGVSNDYFISRLDVNLIENDNWYKRIYSSGLPIETKELLSKTTNNSNPILVFFKLH